tara:strand:+ start:1184 stop:2374 length:1191 start_codon:yes stop_codon:yes gene_type:complete
MNITNNINAKRKISILGSTGSIGKNTLDIISYNKDLYNIEALTAYSNFEKLSEQALMFKPNIVVIGDENCYFELKKALSGTNIEVAAGKQALVDVAGIHVDWTMIGIVGNAGLEPSMAAAKLGSTIAIANKECLVAAGSLFMSEIEKNKTTLLPVDSEHNAIFQIIEEKNTKNIENIYLTASGGPFLNIDISELNSVTPEQAVAHPNWSMGNKISVDSSTMMNKGLELIEAHHLFSLEKTNIDLGIIIHPESIIHGMVSLIDGSVIAHMSTPDMRIPILHTLSWPTRSYYPNQRLDLAKISSLTFFDPDIEKFPAIKICKEVLLSGGSVPVVLNAANELAVYAFLDKKIKYLDIIKIIELVLNKHAKTYPQSIEEIIFIDNETRQQTAEEINQCLM